MFFFVSGTSSPLLILLFIPFHPASLSVIRDNIIPKFGFGACSVFYGSIVCVLFIVASEFGSSAHLWQSKYALVSGRICCKLAFLLALYERKCGMNRLPKVGC